MHSLGDLSPDRRTLAYVEGSYGTAGNALRVVDSRGRTLVTVKAQTGELTCPRLTPWREVLWIETPSSGASRVRLLPLGEPLSRARDVSLAGGVLAADCPELSRDGGAVGLTEGEVSVEVRLAAPVRDVRDERTGRKLPDGNHFRFRIAATEAALFSFAGPPPR